VIRNRFSWQLVRAVPARNRDQVSSVDETRQQVTPADDGWPRRPDQPWGTGQPRGSRSDARPDLRVSDAERDAVVTELGEHFQQGLAARTESDLSKLLGDLPSLREASITPQPRTWAPRLPLLVPLIFATILIVGSAAHGRHGEWALWPLWWIIPIIVLRFAWWRRSPQRRQWQ
jgi:hypothetical protein